MKKLFVAIILTLFVSVSLFGQLSTETIGLKSVKPAFITVTLDSAVEKVIYVGFPTTRWAQFVLDSTALTTAHPGYNNEIGLGTGDVHVAVLLDTVTREESDSLFSWIKPYGYVKAKEAWYESTNDSTFLRFSQAARVQNTVHYLNWATGGYYTIQLSNELWSTGGFTIHLKQYTYDVSGASTRAYVGVWVVR